MGNSEGKRTLGKSRQDNNCNIGCMRPSNSHVKTIKYFNNKDLFEYLKLQRSSRYTIFDVINLLSSVLCRCLSITVTARLSSEEDRENATQG